MSTDSPKPPAGPTLRESTEAALLTAIKTNAERNQTEPLRDLAAALFVVQQKTHDLTISPFLLPRV